jgi:triacylglycerol esterase/lipase EstA (alpha/beta hydrolase family)
VLSSLAPARRRLLLTVTAIVLVVLVAVLATVLVVNRRSGRTSAVSQQTVGPVLLVPGYGGSTSALNALAVHLRAAGRSATVFQPPGNATGDLRVQAQALATSAEQLRQSSGAGSIDVVGYSAGGVVARLWVRDYGGAQIARRIVTLGSPQHGTQLAGLAGSLVPGDCPVACQQLEPGSELLDGLNAGDETPAGPTFVSIWSSGDDVVIPPESAILAGALNVEVQALCTDEAVNHSQLPTNPVVEGIVTIELRAGAPTTLTATDCATIKAS